MNKKHINSVISKKMNEFWDTIDDSQVKTTLKENTIITGGAIVSLLQGTKPKDFDIYLRTKEAAIIVANYFVSKFDKKDVLVKVTDDRVKLFIQSKGVSGEVPTSDDVDLEAIDTDDAPEENCVKYKPVFFSSNAITLSGGIQIIVRFYGEPEEIHKNYDFVHCTNYWTSWDKKVVLRVEALEAIINRELVYIGSKYPLASMFRIRKFLNRGYHINAGQMLKIGMQISTLDLTNSEVLEDQLIGVDTAYFSIIINAVQARQNKEDEPPLDPVGLGAYIFELIDRLF